MFDKCCRTSWVTHSRGGAGGAVSRVHFDLTHVQNLAGILRGLGPFADDVTAGELRYIMANWDRFRAFVTFYRNGVEVLPPW